MFSISTHHAQALRTVRCPESFRKAEFRSLKSLTTKNVLKGSLFGNTRTLKLQQCSKKAYSRKVQTRAGENAEADEPSFDFSVLQKRMSQLKDKEENNQASLLKNWKESKCTRSLVVHIDDWVRRLSLRGDSLAVGTHSGAVLVYDLPSQVLLHQFDGTTAKKVDSGRKEITCIDISPDGSLVASGSLDGKIRVHSLEEHGTVYEAFLGDGPVTDLHFQHNSNRLVASTACWAVEVQTDNWLEEVHVRVCDRKSQVQCMATAHHPETGDQWFVFGMSDGKIHAQCTEAAGLSSVKCWVAPDDPGAQLEETIGSTQQLNRMQISKRRKTLDIQDGDECEVATKEGELKENKGSSEAEPFEAHLLGVTAIQATFEGDQLVVYSGCENGEVASWEVNADSVENRWKLFGHRGPVVSIASNSDRLVTGALDGTVRVWLDHHEQGRPIYAISGFTAFLGSVAFDESRLICDGTNNVVIMHDFLNVADDV